MAITVMAITIFDFRTLQPKIQPVKKGGKEPVGYFPCQ